jgi:hypothetical protein
VATRRLSTQPGDQLKDVTEAVGAATVSKSIEMTFDLANVKDGNTKPLTRLDVLLGFRRLRDYIIALKWPPA